jgi:hypothetical protein
MTVTGLLSRRVDPRQHRRFRLAKRKTPAQTPELDETRARADGHQPRSHSYGEGGTRPPESMKRRAREQTGPLSMPTPVTSDVDLWPLFQPAKLAPSSGGLDSAFAQSAILISRGRT